MPQSATTAATKQGRTLRYNQDTGTLTISVTTGRKTTVTEYTVEKIGSDFGDAMKLTKNVGGSDDECDVYHVNLSDMGSTCECRGWLRHGHCKHVSSLTVLRERRLI